jgi:DNA-binding NarL/FixJ family response regulator
MPIRRPGGILLDITVVTPEGESATQALSVVVADGSYLVREAIAYLLDSNPDVEVVASCEDEEALAEAMTSEHPRVVVVNVRIWSAVDVDVAQPGVGLVLIGHDANARDGLAWLESGGERIAILLIPRLRDDGYLENAIRVVAAGGTFVDAGIIDAMGETPLGS